MDELLQPFRRMLEVTLPSAIVRSIEAGGETQTAWDAIGESGFLDALVREDAGGAGLSLGEIGLLLCEVGRFAVPLPLAETMVARALLADAAVTPPPGPIAFATSNIGAGARIPRARAASHLLVDDGERLRLVAADDRAGDAATLERGPEGLRPVAALLHAAAISGAIDRVMDMTIAYANDRMQFGKPIGRQQAIQHRLAVMAEQAVACRIAVEMALAGGASPSLTTAAIAKSIASAAVPTIASGAHAVHGAIGISQEHDLQLYTRFLHAGRLAEGAEDYWRRQLGAERLRANGGALDWLLSHGEIA